MLKRAVLVLFFVVSTVLPRADGVYAPIPEVEKGEAFTTTLRSGLYYDSNIFGSFDEEIDSYYFRVAPSVHLNASLAARTMASLSYDLVADYMENRPDKKRVFGHTLTGKLMHTFAPGTDLELRNTFNKQGNPEATVDGLPVNTDQSFKANQVDLKLNHGFDPKTAGFFKYRNTHLNFRTEALTDRVDRNEHLFGLGVDYELLPPWRMVGEIRYQDINYRRSPETKDKASRFYLVGVDREFSKGLLQSRFGAEHRKRRSFGSTTVPFVEITGIYKYTAESFLSLGALYRIDETGDVLRFRESRTNRFLVNVQHYFTSMIVGSGGITYDRSTLKGRTGIPDSDDRTVRLGLALSYLPHPRWAVIGSYDHDRITSDVPEREQKRNRVGLSARYTF